MLRRKYYEIESLLSTKKKRNENDKKVTYKIKFIDSVRFMAVSLSSLTDNLADRLTKLNLKYLSLILNMPQPKTTLILKCVFYNKNYEKEYYNGLEKDSKTHIGCVIKTLTCFV